MRAKRTPVPKTEAAPGTDAEADLKQLATVLESLLEHELEELRRENDRIDAMLQGMFSAKRRWFPKPSNGAAPRRP
jgi:hypothetical protein